MINLFPLPLVLFPNGRLQLQIFETRYLDMIKHCSKSEEGFGVILIEDGDQVMREKQQVSPKVSPMGTYCEIVDFDQQANGLLQITVEGRRKFSVQKQLETDDRLLLASVTYCDAELDCAIPKQYHDLVDLLDNLLSHPALAKLQLEPDLNSAIDVGARLTEYLPCGNQFKQRMFEGQDPLARLEQLALQIASMQAGK